MIDHRAHHLANPDLPKVELANIGRAGEPSETQIAAASYSTASETEETSALTHVLSLFAEHMMSHVRAQIREAPTGDRIFSDKSMPA
jgi:predicted ATPase